MREGLPRFRSTHPAPIPHTERIPHMTDSPLKNEATGGTTTFDHFGRTWTVPTKRHLSHIVKMRDEIRGGVGSADLMIAETFLSPEEFDALLAVDPDEEELDAFTTRITEAMGFGDSGNSSPSSTSS